MFTDYFLYVSWFCQPASDFHVNANLSLVSHNANHSVSHISEYLKTINDCLLLIAFINNSLALSACFVPSSVL